LTEAFIALLIRFTGIGTSLANAACTRLASVTKHAVVAIGRIRAFTGIAYTITVFIRLIGIGDIEAIVILIRNSILISIREQQRKLIKEPPCIFGDVQIRLYIQSVSSFQAAVADLPSASALTVDLTLVSTLKLN
jgi:hypothetical protein